MFKITKLKEKYMWKLDFFNLKKGQNYQKNNNNLNVTLLVLLSNEINLPNLFYVRVSFFSYTALCIGTPKFSSSWEVSWWLSQTTVGP